MPPSSPPDLLALAARIVQEGGPESLTMDALVAASGLSRATVYRQVGGRDAVLGKLAERGIQIEDQPDIRTRILDAAGEIFPRLGLEGATIEAIAEQAGVGVATIYRQFGDKRGLIEAFLGSLTPRRSAWSLAREPSGDLAADLERLCVALLTAMQDNGGLMRLTLVERLRGNSELDGLSASPDRTIHAITALLSHYQRAGAIVDSEPAVLARLLMGMLFIYGVGGEIMGLGTAPDPAQIVPVILRTFLHGVTMADPVDLEQRGGV